MCFGQQSICQHIPFLKKKERVQKRDFCTFFSRPKNCSCRGVRFPLWGGGAVQTPCSFNALPCPQGGRWGGSETPSWKSRGQMSKWAAYLCRTWPGALPCPCPFTEQHDPTLPVGGEFAMCVYNQPGQGMRLSVRQTHPQIFRCLRRCPGYSISPNDAKTLFAPTNTLIFNLGCLWASEHKSSKMERFK